MTYIFSEEELKQLINDHCSGLIDSAHIHDFVRSLLREILEKVGQEEEAEMGESDVEYLNKVSINGERARTRGIIEGYLKGE